METRAQELNSQQRFLLPPMMIIREALWILIQELRGLGLTERVTKRDSLAHVYVEWEADHLTWPLQDFSIKFLVPAMKELAQNVAKDGSAMSSAPFGPMLPGADFCADETFDGITIRMIRSYRIEKDDYPTRFTVGYKKSA